MKLFGDGLAGARCCFARRRLENGRGPNPLQDLFRSRVLAAVQRDRQRGEQQGLAIAPRANRGPQELLGLDSPVSRTITNLTECASLGAGSASPAVNASWTWEWPSQTDPNEQIVRATPGITFGFNPWNTSRRSGWTPVTEGTGGIGLTDYKVTFQAAAQ